MVAQTDTTPAAGQSILGAVDDLAPVIAARADEIEVARRVPADLVAELTAAGCFGMLRPPSHGGSGVELATSMRVYEELSRADASVGWTVAIGAGCWLDVVGLPRSTFDAVFADDPDVKVGGAIAPAGVAVPAEGGYRVTGRWGFVSGCQHCDWIYGNCIEEGAMGNGTMPPLRVALFRAGEVEIEDTWSVSGLCGTGSHHVVADDVFVPAERTFALLSAEPCVDGPLMRIPLPSPYVLQMASGALGIAQGALDDIVALATDKVPLFAGATLAANPLFQNQLGEADARLRAARALLYAEAADAWATALARDPFTPEHRARIRASGVWAADTAAAVVDAAYRAGGGSSLYRSSPLQRRFRDVHALTQHLLVKLDSLTTVGAVMTGQDVDTTFL
ncbi:MAG TPA: acyl-CoA dehydrogenase family protein [Acidimicrobiales bacterium]|nr:acyl-CoA dehydrogenase family protein [Acidimicrobiales bacterium]